MLKALLDYAAGEVRPRIGAITRSSQFLVAVAVGIAMGLFGDDLRIGEATVGNTMVVVLAYAAIAFGFCLAGLTIALTLPDREFAVELATREKRNDSPAVGEGTPRPPKTAYSDLIFVFSWTAVAHWLTIAGGFAFLVGAGPDRALLATDAVLGARIVVGLVAGVLAYGVLQFLVAVFTLSQAGAAFIAVLRRSNENA